MTRRTFYKKLRKIAPHFNWSILGGRFIQGEFKEPNNDRFLTNKFCPITAINYVENNSYYRFGEFMIAASKLGLLKKDMEKIVDAADKRLDYNKSIRRTLLKIVGLTEQLS